MTEESAVKVCVRVRPLIEREESSESESAEPVQLFWKADEKSIQQIDDGNSSKSFVYDRVFTAEETTNQLYQNIAKPLVVSAVQGYNGTIFAYGQTSSGKTFTMMGSNSTPGVIPLAVEDVFQTIKSFPKKEFLLRVSYMEIYNETVTDLLVDSWKRKPLEVREAINKNIYVADLTEEVVTTPAQALSWIRKGEKNRHYGKTKMNQRSSRSHTIFRMILESRERSDPVSGENADGAIIVSHLNLVDLAGSERVRQTGAEGARFKEGCNINRSLFTLGQVIKKLTDEGQKGFTNYRDSKLTRILQNSLGGNAKTVIICTITPVALDETLSTLQFASTAKKMKNDPHVTEVSDDGALLKRYRNEIVDLKRRLHEVSSVTQTTATEKEVLSQLLQEKDQLQREQEDRIKNLTQLLVTSSNQITFQKKQKRRMTWGGNMRPLTATHPSAFGGGVSEHSFAEAFPKRRKADRSCLSVLGEDDEDFHWEIPDEPQDDMGMSCVTVRSFEDSPKDFGSPNRMRELSEKMSDLEVQLEMEIQQKDKAMTEVETLDSRVCALEQQLQTESQQKQEALQKVEMLEGQLKEQSSCQSDPDDQMRRGFSETIQLCESLASEKEMMATERDYLKQELGMFIEQIESLEKENTALTKELEERRETDEFKTLEEEFRKEHENNLQKTIEASELQCRELQNKVESLSEELRRKSEFAEELQNMNGRDLVQEVAKLRRSLDDAEGVSRDAKKDWAHLRSRNITLEEEHVTLTSSHDQMKAEVDGLRSQLETEKSRNRKMQSDLQKELNVAFEENTKLTTLLDGKVPKNLIDSVELERTVAALNKDLTASGETLKAQLEELASLQTLPVKVDSLMRQVAELTQQLCAAETQRDGLISAQTLSQEEAEQLRVSLQTSQEEVLKMQAELSAAALREEQLRVSLQTSQEEVLKIQAELSAAALREEQLREEVESLRSDLESSEAERGLLSAATEEKHSELTESKERRVSLTEKVEELQQLVRELEEKLEQAAETQNLLQSLQNKLQVQKSDLEKLHQQESGLKEQIQSLSEELQCVREEKETLQTSAQSSAEETEKLLSDVSSLTAERDQLRTDLQENVELMIENQEELRAALEKNKEQRDLIKELKAAQTSTQDAPQQETSAQLEELQTQIGSLSEQLQVVEAERDALLVEKETSCQSSSEEMEDLQHRLKSLTEDRDQLLQTLEALRQEKQQLTQDMEDREDTLQAEMRTLTEQLQRVTSERDALLEEKETSCQSSSEEMEDLQHRLKSLTKDRDKLLQTLEALRQEKQQLTQDLEDREDTLQAEMRARTEQLQSVTSERDALLEEKETSCQSSSEQMEDLQHRLKSLTEDRDQLLQTLEALRQEKQQLTQDMEERMEMFALSHSEFNQPGTLNLELQGQDDRVSQLQHETKQLEAALQAVREEKSHLEDELQKNKEQTAETQNVLDTLLLQIEELKQRNTEMERQSQERQTHLEHQVVETECRLRSAEEELQQHRQNLSDQINVCEQKESDLQQQIQSLSEQLQSVTSERDALLVEKETSCQSSSEEMEDLQHRLKSLTEDRDQLLQTLEALRQEKQQLTQDMEDREDTLQAEMRTLTEQLQSVTSERDALLEEKETSCQSSSEEMEDLQHRLKSLTEDRDQLLQTLEALRQEKQQLTQDMEDREDTLQAEISSLQEKLSQQEGMRGEREIELQHHVQQLEGKLQASREKPTNAEAEAESSQQLLSEANQTISALKEQLSRLDQSSSSRLRESLTSRLKDSTNHLQRYFDRFQQWSDWLPKCNPKDLMEKGSADMDWLPEPTRSNYKVVLQLTWQAGATLGTFVDFLQAKGLDYKTLFEDLVQKDLDVFEERRLQDVLLCRAQAPSFSLKDQNFTSLWEQRLTELQQKRSLYLQKMWDAWEKLKDDFRCCREEMRADFSAREKFFNQLKAACDEDPDDQDRLNSLLNPEMDRLSAFIHSRKTTLQPIMDGHNSLYEEMKLLLAQTDRQLREDRSWRSTLLQPVKTELSLLKDNQQLAIQLQQTEEKVQALCAQKEQLEEAQTKANSRVSNHKEATQLLQTELQDSRAQVEEKENMIQTLQSKLRESEKNASPGAAELRTRLFKVELELSSASEKHQKEIQRLTAVLNEKEESLRKLKETIRKSQQQGEESFLQGEDLHARLTHTKGVLIQSSVQQEKTKLEEEVTQLQMRITELESLVSSQQAEISKWKSRAVKLKVKNRGEGDKPSSPCTATKRVLHDTSTFCNSPKKFVATSTKLLDSPRKLLDSPRKLLDSPRKLLDSPKVPPFDPPKSRFFDVGESSDLLSRSFPRQFFDNSSLGTVPGAGALQADRTEELLPKSPRPEEMEMCITQ